MLAAGHAWRRGLLPGRALGAGWSPGLLGARASLMGAARFAMYAPGVPIQRLPRTERASPPTSHLLPKTQREGRASLRPPWPLVPAYPRPLGLGALAGSIGWASARVCELARTHASPPHPARHILPAHRPVRQPPQLTQISMCWPALSSPLHPRPCLLARPRLPHTLPAPAGSLPTPPWFVTTPLAPPGPGPGDHGQPPWLPHSALLESISGRPTRAWQ